MVKDSDYIRYLKYNEKTTEDKRNKLVSIIEERVKIFDNIINRK
jgi:hypothetical protein